MELYLNDNIKMYMQAVYSLFTKDASAATNEARYQIRFSLFATSFLDKYCCRLFAENIYSNFLGYYIVLTTIVVLTFASLAACSSGERLSFR